MKRIYEIDPLAWPRCCDGDEPRELTYVDMDTFWATLLRITGAHRHGYGLCVSRAPR